MENKEEINKHLEGFVRTVPQDETVDLSVYLKDYQKKNNLMPSIEVGKVYKYDDVVKGIMFVTEIRGKDVWAYGFGDTNKFTGNCVWTHINDSSLKEATQEEWQSLLLEKAKNDYPKGTEVQSLIKGYSGKLCDRRGFYFIGSQLWASGGSYYNLKIFDNGVWAEIIQEEETKKTDVTVKLNKGKISVFIDGIKQENVNFK